MDKKKLQTPSQTIGPFFAYGLTPEQYSYDFKSLVGNDMVLDLEDQDRIEIRGTVYDGEGNAVSDAMVELWQDDGEHKLFGRHGTGTDVQSRFLFKTIKPKSVNGQAPFIHVIIFMRGQLLHSYSRIYFSDEASLNSTDDVLSSLDAERRNTLIAEKKGSRYTFDIHMQGDQETVFFDV